MQIDFSYINFSENLSFIVLVTHKMTPKLFERSEKEIDYLRNSIEVKEHLHHLGNALGNQEWVEYVVYVYVGGCEVLTN